MELEYLSKIGFTKGEIKIYTALLDIGISTLNKIQEKTGIDRRNIYDILNKLIEKGLVSYTIEKGKKTFQITHPDKILNYLEEKKKEIEETKKEITPNIPDLVKVFNKTKNPIRAEVYRGKESLKALHEESLNYPKQYWIGGNSTVESNVDTDMKNWFNHWMKRRAKKKVMMYDLADHGTYLENFKDANLSKHKKEYHKYCQLPKDLKSPMVILIFGDKVAQILWSAQPFAFVLESKEIRESFMKYFYYFWKEPW